MNAGDEGVKGLVQRLRVVSRSGGLNQEEGGVRHGDATAVKEDDGVCIVDARSGEAAFHLGHAQTREQIERHWFERCEILPFFLCHTRQRWKGELRQLRHLNHGTAEIIVRPTPHGTILGAGLGEIQSSIKGPLPTASIAREEMTAPRFVE